MTAPGKEAYGGIPEGRTHSGDRDFLGDMGYRSIIDLLPCYVSVQDVNLRILFANMSFEKDFGSGVGRICHEVYKGTVERCPSCPVQRTFEDKRVHVSEEMVRLSNGERADLAVYSAPILDIFGDVKAVIELSGNITKLKEPQRELAFLGQSVAVLSHDIKNILEGLQGGAYVVDEGIKDGDMELAGKGWEVVKRNIGDITSVTRNILYSSKKRFLKRQNIHLGTLIGDVAVLFSERAKAIAAVLETKTNPSLLITRLDPSGIRRMLNNLLCNALEACQVDKKKHFHKVMVRTDFYDKTHVMIEVEDNGIGMTDATRKKIFEEFYSTKGDSGTGLGMLVVNRVVEAHGGRIELLTARGKGTTFRVILPLR
ncbi:MAG: ATP-binding protein [Desulfatiglandaceae bacterium]